MNCTSLFIYLFSKGYLLVAFDAREQSRPASTGEAMLTFITGASAQGTNCKERQPRPIGAFPTLPEDHVRCSPLCVIDFRPSVRHELPNPPTVTIQAWRSFVQVLQRFRTIQRTIGGGGIIYIEASPQYSRYAAVVPTTKTALVTGCRYLIHG